MMHSENSEHSCEMGEKEQMMLFERTCKKPTKRGEKMLGQVIIEIIRPETGFTSETP